MGRANAKMLFNSIGRYSFWRFIYFEKQARGPIQVHSSYTNSETAASLLGLVKILVVDNEISSSNNSGVYVVCRNVCGVPGDDRIFPEIIR